MFYPKPKPLTASASGNKAGITVQAGCAWLLADNAPNPSLPPVGFTDLSYLLSFFNHFNPVHAYYLGSSFVTSAATKNSLGPIFGCLCAPGNGGLTPQIGWLYLPSATSFMGRLTLAHYAPAVSLGRNVGPLLSQAQMAQFQLQYVAISLNTTLTALQLPSTHSAILNMAGSQGLFQV
jgi:hypothetical protein